MTVHPSSPPSATAADVHDELVQRFVDGALDPRERVRVEAILSTDPDAFERVMAYQHQNVLLQGLHGARDDNVMLPPAALGLARKLHHVRRVRHAVVASIAACVIVSTGALGWQAQRYVAEHAERPPVVAVFPTQTLQPTPTALTPTPAVAIPGGDGLRSDDAGSAPTAATRLDVHPPNLQRIGYQLVDGRADLTAYGPVIRFSYDPIDTSKGSRLALTVAAFGSERDSLATNINPQQTSLFWQDGQLLFALSGALEPARLLRVAETVAAERARQRESEAAPVAVAPVVEPQPVEPAAPRAVPADDEKPKET